MTVHLPIYIPVTERYKLALWPDGELTDALQHSASSLKLGFDCSLAWWYRYREGIRETGPAKRSLVIGHLVHAVVAAWYRGANYQDPELELRDAEELVQYCTEQTAKGYATTPAEVIAFAVSRAVAGMRHLPDRKHCGKLLKVESPISASPHYGDGRPRLYTGAIDLLVYVDGVTHVLIDHKTTSGYQPKGESFNAWHWVPSEDQLKADPQVLLYAFSAMTELGLDSIACRWVYYLVHPTKAPDSTLRSFRLTYAEAVAGLRAWDALAKRLEDLEERPPISPLANHPELSPCRKYAGCFALDSRGGPCAPFNYAEQIVNTITG